MTAKVSNAHLIIREGGNVLARRPCGPVRHADVEERANSILKRLRVTGDSTAAWVMRRKLAEQVIGEVLG